MFSLPMRRSGELMISISAPRVICFYKQNTVSESLTFIAQLYESVKQGNFPIVVDFSQTREITAAASVALFAHINRMQLFYRIPNLFIFHCVASPIFQTFFVPYYLEPLRADTESKLKKLEKMVHIYQSGTEPHLKLANLKDYFSSLRRQYSGNSKVKEMLGLLETALYEALLNVNHHAYLGINTAQPARWWQRLHIDVESNHCSFIVCDLGIGLVESYLQHGITNNLSIFHSRTDILRDILKPGVSRWNSIDRGNGFSEILKPTQQLNNVGMWIFSNDLHFEYFPKFNINICEEMPYTIPGTLIEWVVDLKEN